MATPSEAAPSIPATLSIDEIGRLHLANPEAASIAFEQATASALSNRLPKDAIDDAERWFKSMGAEL